MPVTFATMMVRGNGSTLHRKNLYPILGKPVLQYAVEACLRTQFVNKVFVWSEDEDVLEIASKSGAVPLERPKDMVHYFAGFTTVNQWVELRWRQIVKHAGQSGDFHLSFNCNNLLVRPETMDRMFEKLTGTPEAFSIIALKPVHPGLCLKTETGYLFPFWNFPNLPMAQHPQLYRLMGVSISRMAMKLPEMNGKVQTLYHAVSREEGLDFQSEDDVPLAEFYLSKRRGTSPLLAMRRKNTR